MREAIKSKKTKGIERATEVFNAVAMLVQESELEDLQGYGVEDYACCLNDPDAVQNAPVTFEMTVDEVRVALKLLVCTGAIPFDLVPNL